MSKPSEQEKYNNLLREVNVIKTIGQFLMSGKFSGAAAQDLAISQMYIQGLLKHMQAECDKLAPLPLPPVESKASPVVADSSSVSQSVSTGA
jgi:hypothetical protein